MSLGKTITVAAACALLTACGDPTESDNSSRHITAADVTPWPFSVQGGTLRCELNEVTFTPDGTTDVYAMNGRAKGTSKYRELKPDDPLWLTDETIPVEIGPPMKMSIGTVIREGLKLCQ